MADIALEMGEWGGDIIIDGLDLARDDGFETSVIISLFTDRRATPEQVPAELPKDDLRGFWGDVQPVVEGDFTGSHLWLLAREKQTTQTLSRAKQYTEEALQWMLDDKVATRVEVFVEYVAMGWMGITIDIYRPDNSPVQYRYQYEWKAQAARRVA
jgi:phage gp46-like protein